MGHQQQLLVHQPKRYRLDERRNVAAFGWGSPGTLSNSLTATLGANITAAGLIFNNQNYTIAPDASNQYGLTIGSSGITANASATIAAPLALSASQTWTVAGGQTLNVSGSVSGSTYQLTKAGAGTVNLSGSNTLGHGFSVSNGVLQLSGGSTMITGSTDSLVEGSGVFFLMTGGTLNISTGTTNAGSLDMDSGGVADISGGSLNVLGANHFVTGVGDNSIMVGVQNPVPGTMGTMFIRGTASVSAKYAITMGVSTSASGMLVVADSAQVATNTSVIIGGFYGANGEKGILTQTGGTITSTAPLYLGGYTGTSGTGSYNLDGGTVIAPALIKAGNSGTLNLNGGTIRASSSSTTFMQTLTAANVYGGGVTIDTNSNNITVGQALLGTSGTGLAMTPLTSGLGTTSYAIAPTVSFSSTSGGGATGYAKLDPSSGTITGVYITCPGSGYTSAPTIVLNGSNTTSVTAPLGLANTQGGLTKIGSGALTLSAGNSFGGVTLISGGSLVLGNAAALSMSTFDSSGAGTLNFGTLTSGTFGGLQGSTGTLTLNNAASSPAGVALSIGNNGNSGTFSGVVTGSGSLTKIGAGTFTLSGSNGYTGGTTISAGVLILSGTNAYGGGTTINGGSLQIGVANALPTAGAVNLANAANTWLNLNNFNQTLGTLSGGGTTGGNVALGSGTLTLQNAGSTTYGGIISGSGGGLVVQRNGALTLTGSSTYSGGTTVNGGTLQLNGSALTGLGPIGASSPITVNSGATLLATGLNALFQNGSDYTSRTLTINEGGTLIAAQSDHITLGYTLNVVGGTIASRAAPATTEISAISSCNHSTASTSPPRATGRHRNSAPR